ncbi:MAG: hypothetical protein EAZ61_05455 [Oscillatoriales cyanobacterium]|nr:MAG: hypothetical protein EAZ61_05455 [Oscillatoriales cyanobacterium]
MPRESTGATSGGISCADGCEGRYQGSQTEVIEHDPLIRAYRNANGELEFELIQSSGSAEADRAALTTAQQASYTSDRDEFTIRARIAEDASASPPVQDSTPISEAPPATPPEPAYEEPAYDEPVYEEPIYEEPVYEEPIYEEPVYEEPVYEEPIHEASTAEEPAYAEPTSEEPVSEEPSGEASTTEEPLNDTGDES